MRWGVYRESSRRRRHRMASSSSGNREMPLYSCRLRACSYHLYGVCGRYPSHMITPDITNMPLEEPVKRPDLWLPRKGGGGRSGGAKRFLNFSY